MAQAMEALIPIASQLIRSFMLCKFTKKQQGCKNDFCHGYSACDFVLLHHNCFYVQKGMVLHGVFCLSCAGILCRASGYHPWLYKKGRSAGELYPSFPIYYPGWASVHRGKRKRESIYRRLLFHYLQRDLSTDELQSEIRV